MEQNYPKVELIEIDCNTLIDLNVRWVITKKALCPIQNKDKS